MKHLKPLNRKARRVTGVEGPDVYGYACSVCCTAWAPGWETGESGDVDPCPWLSDLYLCWVTCYWTGQVPDTYGDTSDWLDDCGNAQNDWYRLRVVDDP